MNRKRKITPDAAGNANETSQAREMENNVDKPNKRSYTWRNLDENGQPIRNRRKSKSNPKEVVKEASTSDEKMMKDRNRGTQFLHDIPNSHKMKMGKRGSKTDIEVQPINPQLFRKQIILQNLGKVDVQAKRKVFATHISEVAIETQVEVENQVEGSSRKNASSVQNSAVLKNVQKAVSVNLKNGEKSGQTRKNVREKEGDIVENQNGGQKMKKVERSSKANTEKEPIHPPVSSEVRILKKNAKENAETPKYVEMEVSQMKDGGSSSKSSGFLIDSLLGVMSKYEGAHVNDGSEGESSRQSLRDGVGDNVGDNERKMMTKEKSSDPQQSHKKQITKSNEQENRVETRMLVADIAVEVQTEIKDNKESSSGKAGGSKDVVFRGVEEIVMGNGTNGEQPERQIQNVGEEGGYTSDGRTDIEEEPIITRLFRDLEKIEKEVVVETPIQVADVATENGNVLESSSGVPKNVVRERIEEAVMIDAEHLGAPYQWQQSVDEVFKYVDKEIQDYEQRRALMNNQSLTIPEEFKNKTWYLEIRRNPQENGDPFEIGVTIQPEDTDETLILKWDSDYDVNQFAKNVKKIFVELSNERKKPDEPFGFWDTHEKFDCFFTFVSTLLGSNAEQTDS